MESVNDTHKAMKYFVVYFLRRYYFAASLSDQRYPASLNTSTRTCLKALACSAFGHLRNRLHLDDDDVPLISLDSNIPIQF